MPKIFPLTENFKSTTFINAFILNALSTALIAAIAIELRLRLNNKKSDIYYFFNKILHGKDLHDYQVFSIELVITFIAAFLVYLLLHVLFDFGGGMLIDSSEGTFI